MLPYDQHNRQYLRTIQAKSHTNLKHFLFVAHKQLTQAFPSEAPPPTPRMMPKPREHKGATGHGHGTSQANPDPGPQSTIEEREREPRESRQEQGKRRRQGNRVGLADRQAGSSSLNASTPPPPPPPRKRVWGPAATPRYPWIDARQRQLALIETGLDINPYFPILIETH